MVTTFDYPGDRASDRSAKTGVWDTLNGALAGLDKMLAQWRSVKVQVQSRDEKIALTVDHAGHLTSLTLADDVTSCYSAAGFSHTFNDLLARAADAATEEHHKIGGANREALDLAVERLIDPGSELWRE